MTYNGKILRRAKEKYEADKEARHIAYETRREAIITKNPRLRELDNQIRSAPGRALADALRKGVDPLPVMERFKRESLGLQEERRKILLKMGLPENALEEVPACPSCGDSGYLKSGQICPDCLKKYYTREQRRELSRTLDLSDQSFETFSLRYYPDSRHGTSGVSARKNMESVRNICESYARDFGPHSGNLLLFGDPGLGKTFLSAAIARVVSGNGFSVVYDTAGRIFERFENRKFNRDDTDEYEDEVRHILSCDLLILDDLGTEMTTAFIQSALYEIINTRLLNKLSTIINTNLKPDKLESRYAPPIASRLKGEYVYLPFSGDDIRWQLKNETQKNQWNRS